MSTPGPKKPDRLRRRSDFLRVQGAGRKWVSPTVIVQAGPGETPRIRFGLTATKKLGGAVVRNRIRRRLREAVRQLLKAAPQAVAVHDIVLIGRAETATCPFPALLKDLKWCLKRLEVTGHENRDNVPA